MRLKGVGKSSEVAPSFNRGALPVTALRLLRVARVPVLSTRLRKKNEAGRTGRSVLRLRGDATFAGGVYPSVCQTTSDRCSGHKYSASTDPTQDFSSAHLSFVDVASVPILHEFLRAHE